MNILDDIQQHPFIRIAIFFAIGVAVGEVSHLPAIVCLALSLAALVVSIILYAAKIMPVAQSVALLLSFLSLGMGRYAMSEKQMEVILPNGIVEYKALVLSEPREHGKVVMCDMMLLNGRLKGRRMRASVLKDTVACRYKQLHIGTTLLAQSELSMPRSIYKNSNFDYSSWMRGRGYVANTFIFYKNWQPTEVAESEIPFIERFRIKMSALREKMLEQYTKLGLGGQVYAVVAAMTLGEKSEMSKDTKNVYSISGASHVLAVSGLHLGIIYGVLSFLFAGRRWKAGQLVILLLIWLYAILTGLSASVVRSAMMLSLFSLGSLLGGSHLSKNTLFMAGFFLMLANPLYLWDISFQMSFMAVAGITMLYKPMYDLWVWKKPRCVDLVWGMLCVSVAAQLLTAPLVAYYFERFSCYSLLTNFVVVPTATAVLYLAFGIFVLIPFPSLQQILGTALNYLVTALNFVLEWLASLPGASIENIRINKMQTVLTYVVIVCAILLFHHIKSAIYRSHYTMD